MFFLELEWSLHTLSLSPPLLSKKTTVYMGVSNLKDTPWSIHGPFIHLRIRKIWYFYQLWYMYNAIDLSLFEIYISLEMRINKNIFGFIVLHVLHIVFVYILWSVYIFIHSILAIYRFQIVTDQ